MTGGNVAKEHLLVYALRIGASVEKPDGLREAALAEIVARGPLHPADEVGREQRLLAMVDAACREVFVEAVGHQLAHEVAAAKALLHLAAEHLGVAARDVDPSPLVSQAACEPLPSDYVLDLVEEEVGLLVRQLGGSLNDVVEVGEGEAEEPLILEVHVDDLAPFGALGDELARSLIKEGRLSRAPHADDDVVGARLKHVPARDDAHALDNAALVEYHPLDDIVVHGTTPKCRLQSIKTHLIVEYSRYPGGARLSLPSRSVSSRPPPSRTGLWPSRTQPRRRARRGNGTRTPTQLLQWGCAF